MKVVIYTDGSAKGNPGNGGYGVVMIYGSYRKEISEGFELTTNNRMELLSVIVALENLKKSNQSVMVYSDSKYVVDAIEKGWLFGWHKKGFKGKKNSDLWRRFLSVYRNHTVKFHWIKGHAGNKYNEMCDLLAVQAAESSNLLIDKGYTS